MKIIKIVVVVLIVLTSYLLGIYCGSSSENYPFSILSLSDKGFKIGAQLDSGDYVFFSVEPASSRATFSKLDELGDSVGFYVSGCSKSGENTFTVTYSVDGFTDVYHSLNSSLEWSVRMTSEGETRTARILLDGDWIAVDNVITSERVAFLQDMEYVYKDERWQQR